jgi:hypothetical protein
MGAFYDDRVSTFPGVLQSDMGTPANSLWRFYLDDHGDWWWWESYAATARSFDVLTKDTNIMRGVCRQPSEPVTVSFRQGAH